MRSPPNRDTMRTRKVSSASQSPSVGLTAAAVGRFNEILGSPPMRDMQKRETRVVIGFDIAAVKSERALGNHQPLLSLVGRRERRIHDYASRLLGSRLLAKIGASDIVQEVRIDIVLKFDSFRGTSSSEFDAWLMKIARRRVLRARRTFVSAEKRCVGLEVPVSWASSTVGRDRSPSSILLAWELNARVEDALQELKASDRTIIHWHNRDKLSLAEIADRLGISIEATKKRWGRAVNRLRAVLESGAS
ncbi:MAG: sigma-70 family RNA polymerase sigma factor [Isosphaeraceae bacterium]|nr:sigma-70 family RNA polymerase sigma factor [Isosphaeraceae bacterium]